jgi:predicted Rossmann-fold nucleotide-binding protein
MIKKTNFNPEPLIEHMKSVPYELVHTALYDGAALYDGFRPEQPESEQDYYDRRVYQHYIATGKFPNSNEEAMARTLHDHAMKRQLGIFVKARNYLKIVGVMGGHGLLRTDAMYRQIVFLSKQLTELGFLMVSGGGPGAMEATHLGAWMAGRSDDEVEEALNIVAPAPKYSDEGWISTAFEVMHRYPQNQYESLGIPTWLYGHEPPTPFVTHIAKFFDNSFREDIILTLSFGGIVFTPGSAGTVQEIFQNAVQNHYLSFGFSSPMIFLGNKFWTAEIPIYPLLQGLTEMGRLYGGAWH